MACGEQVVLLSEEESPTPEFSTSRPRVKRTALVGLGFGLVAAVAWWRSGDGSLPVSPQVSVSNFMPAVKYDLELPATMIRDCEGIGAHWPRAFEHAMNWAGSCGEGGDSVVCVDHIMEKYVGDFFDGFINAMDPAELDAWVPRTTRERRQWKDRVIEEMQMWAKHLPGQEVTVDRKKVLLQFATKVPDELDTATICKAINKGRPVAVDWSSFDCRPNHESYSSLRATLKTTAPASAADLGTQEPAGVVPNPSYPAALSYEGNASLEDCEHVFSRKPMAADWIEASLAALDMRECLRSRGAHENMLSRSWVTDCIPPSLSTDGKGYPLHVFEFAEKIGIPGEDCVPNYGSVNLGHCPTLCESGASLSGHLVRPDTDVKVITFDGATQDINAEGHSVAKQRIWDDGPIVGLIELTQEVAACARDDKIIYHQDAQCTVLNTKWDSDLTTHMTSVVVHGWGSEGGTNFYRIRTSLQGDTFDARIAECAIKHFVIPTTDESLAATDYDQRLHAIRAEARCPRGVNFCNAGAGYTDTEDCDGDGILDHWCYQEGDAETPVYESFISSRYRCSTVETPCRRSVLPGTEFGCQRPSGWCMHGERYHRDTDCDGDGNFDHVCESEAGLQFIASADKCVDTHLAEGAKCDWRPHLGDVDADASVDFKLVSNYGHCQHHNSLEHCFVSHADWPHAKYPVGPCEFHVEWSQPADTVKKDEPGCDLAAPEQDETLWLEVLQFDIEPSKFNDNGWLYGERLMVDGVNEKTVKDASTNHDMAQFVKVQDNSVVKWSTDQTVESYGWLVCLRLKKKLPDVHKASCTEIGDDLWSMYFTVDEPAESLEVECDMKKCNVDDKVSSLHHDRMTFTRTTNVCDAGWKAARSSTFSVAFFAATKDTEATFQVLL